VSGGQSVIAATVVHPDRVRLTLNSPLLEGDELSIGGVTDTAGNVSGIISIDPML